MSFGGSIAKSIPDKSPKLAGLDADRTSSSQEAKAVPVIYGRNRVAGTFISKVFNTRSVPKKKSGGKFLPDTTTGTEFYASFAVGICMGRVSELRSIIWDGKEVWGPGDLEQNSYPISVPVTITGRGVMRLYWGGTYAVTKGFYDKYGPKRIKDTPIAENAIIGGAIGAAMVGQRPVAELMTINFAFSAMDYIVNQAPKLHYMFGGQFTLPLVIRAVGGGGRQGSHGRVRRLWAR